MPVRVQTDDFDVGRELAALRNADASIGAVAAFIGTVRDVNAEASVSCMTLEHYPGMTEKALATIVEDAKARWNIAEALVVHRVGALQPADQIVLVACTSAHRGERSPRANSSWITSRRALRSGRRKRRRKVRGGSKRARATTMPPRAGTARASPREA
jgi:molybdopterin synthase catalytic subunit